MKRLFIILAIVGMVFIGCEEKQLPDGYKLLCSLEGDKYTLSTPSGQMYAITWNSKQEVIRHAHYLEKNKNWPAQPDSYWSENYKWEECE